MKRNTYNDPGHAHFLTFSCHERHQLLVGDDQRRLLADAINVSRRVEDFDLWAYVFMPEHVHLLIHPRNDKYEISHILRGIKERASHLIARHWERVSPERLATIRVPHGKRTIHQYWMPGGGYDRNILDWNGVGDTINYIEYNPVRRGLVREPTDWIWSSAGARSGVIDVPLEIDTFEGACGEHREVLKRP